MIAYQVSCAFMHYFAYFLCHLSVRNSAFLGPPCSFYEVSVRVLLHPSPAPQKTLEFHLQSLEKSVCFSAYVGRKQGVGGDYLTKLVKHTPFLKPSLLFPPNSSLLAITLFYPSSPNLKASSSFLGMPTQSFSLQWTLPQKFSLWAYRLASQSPRSTLVPSSVPSPSHSKAPTAVSIPGRYYYYFWFIKEQAEAQSI